MPKLISRKISVSGRIPKFPHCVFYWSCSWSSPPMKKTDPFQRCLIASSRRYWAYLWSICCLRNVARTWRKWISPQVIDRKSRTNKKMLPFSQKRLLHEKSMTFTFVGLRTKVKARKNWETDFTRKNFRNERTFAKSSSTKIGSSCKNQGKNSSFPTVWKFDAFF